MNILSYLDSKGINYKLASGGLEATFPCPVCGKANKFYVNTETGAFICFRGSCDTQGGLKALIELLGDKDKEISIQTSKIPREIQDPDPIEAEVVEEYHATLLERYDSFKEYLENKRGYTIDTVKQFKLGWGNGAIMIPIFDENGNCVNFKQKPDPTRPNPAKGMYSITGRGKNRLFNVSVLMGEQKPQEVIIAEGEWDCMRLAQEGYVAVSATVGTGNFKPEWIPLFQGVGKVYICQDNDVNGAGQSGAKRIAKMFLDQKITTYLVNLPNPKRGLEEKVDITDFFTRLGKNKEHFDLLLQTAQPFVEVEKEEDGKRLVDYLCELAVGAGIIVFLDQNEEPYLILPEQPLVAYPIYGGKLRGWLSSLYMEVSGKSFSGDTYKEVADYLYSKAVHEGKTIQLWNRVAMINSVIYYDIGDGRKVVRIDKSGWEIVHKAPIRFKRFTHQLLQVEPIEGELVEVLDFVNLKSGTDKILYLTYLVAGLNPIIPRALLTLFGDQGSAKSTASRVTRSIIDPSNAGTHHPSKAGNLLSPPKDEGDLANKTLRHYCLYFDNLSYCPEWMSDAFARIVTGSSYSKRKLYTDTDEVTINAMPLLGMNGINLVAEKPDLLDRLLILEMERIPEDIRKTEREFWDGFRGALPRILGGLFSALSRTLELVDDLKLGHLPRMADYATFATAAAIAIGSSQDEFLSAFNQNIKKQNQSAIDSSAVAQVILQFMENKDQWEGPSSQLHKDLLKLAEDSNLKVGGSSGFPKASNWLWKKIQIVRPNLSNFGIKAEHSEDKASSIIKLTKFSKEEGNSSVTADNAILESNKDGSMNGGITKDAFDTAMYSEAGVAEKEVVATIPRLWDETPDR